MKRLSLVIGMAFLAASAAFAQGGGGRGGFGLMGQIKAKADKSFTIQMRARGNNQGREIKVTVDDNTVYYKTEQGKVSDLAVGGLIVVREVNFNNNNFKMINQLMKVDGDVTDEQWAEAQAAARMGGRGGNNAPQPIIGKITSTQPLKVVTKDKTEVTVETNDQTRVMIRSKAAWDDVKEGVNARITPVGQVNRNATEVTAKEVILMPAMGNRGRGN